MEGAQGGPASDEHEGSPSLTQTSSPQLPSILSQGGGWPRVASRLGLTLKSPGCRAGSGARGVQRCVQVEGGAAASPEGRKSFASDEKFLQEAESSSGAWEQRPSGLLA